MFTHIYAHMDTHTNYIIYYMYGYNILYNSDIIIITGYFLYWPIIFKLVSTVSGFFTVFITILKNL